MRQLAVGCALGILALAASASAGERQWYFGIEGGLERSTEYDDAAPALFATLSAKLGEHWGLEGEFGYRYANEDGIDVRQISGMLNAVYLASVSDEVGVSVGAGLGLNHSNIDFNGMVFFPIDEEVSDTQIAAQVKLELSYAIDESIDLIADYRAMRVFENDFNAFDNRTVTIGLRFAL